MQIEEIRKADLNFLCIHEATNMEFHNSDEVYEDMKAEARIDRECMWILHLINGRVIEKELVSMGSGNSAITTPREVFRRAIVKGANKIIVVHNHPSGDPTPSDADIEVSARYVEAGKLLGIPLLDFFIIGTKGYTSFANARLGGF